MRQRKHAVAEALVLCGLSVVPLAGLDQDHSPCRALPPLPATEKVLDAGVSHADQPLIMMMHVIGMTMEMRRHDFDPAAPVTHKMHETTTKGDRGLSPALGTPSLREASAVVVQCGVPNLFDMRH